MVEASEKNHVGVAAGNLPRHISMGLPYEVKDWEKYLAYAEKLARKLHPVTVRLTDAVSAPVAGVTGSYFFRFEEAFGLDELRSNVKSDLVSELGLEIPEKDGVTGQRNITLGFGTAPYENYKYYVDSLDRTRFVGKELIFNQLGVFYYDSEKITATSFICCRRYKLN